MFTFIYWVIQVWKVWFLIPLKWLLLLVHCICLVFFLCNNNFMIFFDLFFFHQKPSNSIRFLNCELIKQISNFIQMWKYLSIQNIYGDFLECSYSILLLRKKCIPLSIHSHYKNDVRTLFIANIFNNILFPIVSCLNPVKP